MVLTITLDSATDINLDADNSNVFLKDNNTVIIKMDNDKVKTLNLNQM